MHQASSSLSVTAMLSSAEGCTLLRHDIVEAVFPYLGVDEVTRLLCTSDRTRADVVQYFTSRRDEPCRIILEAAQEAAERMTENKSWKSRQSTSADQALQRFSLLVEQGLVSEDSGIMQRLMCTPNIPAAVASEVIEAGQRFTYQQLLSAVHSAIPGVEVWMKVYRHLGIKRPVGMHAAAEALCCDETLDLQDQDAPAVRHSDLPDLLHFAVAMPGVGAANLEALCKLPAAADVSVDTVVRVMKAALEAKASLRVRVLCQYLPAANHITVDDLADLLRSAIAGKLSFTVRALCKCPAAQHLDTAVLHQLLQEAVSGQVLGAADALCRLPAAQQLTRQSVAALLQTAALLKDGTQLPGLLELPGAPAIMCSGVEAAVASTSTALSTSDRV